MYPSYTKKIKIKNLKQFENILRVEFNYPISDKEIKYIYDNFVFTCKDN